MYDFCGVQYQPLKRRRTWFFLVAQTCWASFLCDCRPHPLAQLALDIQIDIQKRKRSFPTSVCHVTQQSE